MAMDSPEKRIQRGACIKAIRVSKHISASELARYLNTSRNSYIRIEDGIREMRCFEAIAIAEFLNVHLFKIMDVTPKPIVSSRTREMALESGFNPWELGNRFQKFADSVVQSVQ